LRSLADARHFRFCSRPVTQTGARGTVTDYTYSADHGGRLTETEPAPASGAPRPQARHSYAQRYAWTSYGNGGNVQAAAPIWIRTAASSCRTSAATGNPAAPCATAGDETRILYLYGPDSGPNTLRLGGQEVSDGATTLHICLGYDAQGRKIGDTLREGSVRSIQTITQCSYDAIERLERTAARMAVTRQWSSGRADMTATAAKTALLSERGQRLPFQYNRTNMALRIGMYHYKAQVYSRTLRWFMQGLSVMS
jgi:hypothetical protein